MQNNYITNSVLDRVVPWGQYDSNYIIFRNVENFKKQDFVFPEFLNFSLEEKKEYWWNIWWEYIILLKWNPQKEIIVLLCVQLAGQGTTAS